MNSTILVLCFSILTTSFSSFAGEYQSGRCGLYSKKNGFVLQVGGKPAYETSSYELAKVALQELEEVGTCDEKNEFCSFELKNGEYVVRNHGLAGAVSGNFLAVREIFKDLVQSGVCSNYQMRCVFASQGTSFVALHDGQVYGKDLNPFRVVFWLQDLKDRGLCLPDVPVN